MFEPGEGWYYGTSTDWVGRIIESVSGQNLDEYFRAHIFEPLGMRDTFFNIPDDKRPRLVTVHRRQPDGTLIEQPPTPNPRPVTSFNGGVGLYATASDYLTFLRMLLNAGELNGKRILQAATVVKMEQNQIGSLRVGMMRTAVPPTSNDFTFIADGRDQFGFGFLITADHVPGKRASGSLSWAGAGNTYFWLDPASGVAGVIMMQLSPFSDPKAMSVYDTFERGIYKLAAAK